MLVGGLFLGASIMIGYSYPAEYVYQTESVPYCDQYTQTLALEARSAYAYDMTSGRVLYEHNGDVQLPLASLTKIMTVLTAQDFLPRGSSVSITTDALSSEGDSGLKNGDVWDVRDLMDLTLISSSNDGARALMLASSDTARMTPDDFIRAMNRKARSLDLISVFFINETGLDVSTTTAGAYGTARDVAHLIAVATTEAPDVFDHSVLPKETFLSSSGTYRTIHNTSLVAASLLSSRASKTGYTDLAGGNLALVFEPILGYPVALTVLGSTREGRHADAQKLADAVTIELRRHIVCAHIHNNV